MPGPVYRAYRIDKSYQENHDLGPDLPDPPPVDPPRKKPGYNVLGIPVNSRIGISAGLLLNSRWISTYARWGFDILTYKTVRSQARASFEPPNWVFVSEPLPDDPNEPVHQIAQAPGDPSRISSAVCFGMPSQPPEVWRKDVASARVSLDPGKMLIVSVVASPKPGDPPEAVAADYARCARWAAESGAQVVEANLSCPNVCSAEGQVYLDPAFARIVTSSVRAACPDTPLAAKIGNFPDITSARESLCAIAENTDAVTLVNGMTRPVLNEHGAPAFGNNHLRAAVIGRAIHSRCVQAVKDAKHIVEEQQLDLEILAVGGASTPGDLTDFLNAGAQAVLAGGSPMYAPDLAITACETRVG